MSSVFASRHLPFAKKIQTQTVSNTCGQIRSDCFKCIDLRFLIIEIVGKWLGLDLRLFKQ